MSILSRTRTRSGPSSPNTKAGAKAPLYPTTTTSSDTSSDGSARLTMGGIANIFIKLRHLERRSKESKRPHTITCSSGSEPLTHPRAQKVAVETNLARAALAVKDTYVCAGNGGVDVVRLLRATRKALLEQANMVGANALVDERWSYVINEPKNRPRGQYKISVQYSAAAVHAQCNDTPHPVAMDKIRSVPGLMTVISRNGE